MPKPKTINELFEGGNLLAGLKTRSQERQSVLQHVVAALPADLAEHVASAGIEQGKLTIGVVGASWAARLRYVTETLKMRVGGSTDIAIESVRIKVMPPRKPEPFIKDTAASKDTAAKK